MTVCEYEKREMTIYKREIVICKQEMSIYKQSKQVCNQTSNTCNSERSLEILLHDSISNQITQTEGQYSDDQTIHEHVVGKIQEAIFFCNYNTK